MVTSPAQNVDVLVIGGGPAGAVAAGLLASWNRSVLLVHRVSGQPSLAESLPASTRKLLKFLDLLAVVDAACFHPNHGNLSRWAGTPAVATSADAGYHVPRHEFDRRLRERAQTQGAAIVNGQVQRVEGRDPVQVEIVRSAGDVITRSARVVLDCSGRAGVIARRGLRRFDVGYRTLAVAAEWESNDWPEAEGSYTIVDSYSDGWAWSVPLSPTRRQCTVMLDRERTAISKASLVAVYRAELRKAVGIEERLVGATQISQPWACDASPYGAVRAADNGALLVGDAASFIEPLSSAGVKKAMTSAWRAAVVANTYLAKPEMLQAASDFYNRREQQVYHECVRRSAAFFKEAAAAYPDAFWTTRAASSPEVTVDSGSDLADQDLAGDPSIRLAFERLRAAPGLSVSRTPGFRIEAAAVIEGREVVLRDAIVIPGLESPVRFAAGINLPELVRISTGCHDVASLIGAYRVEVGTVDPADLLKGLSVLVAKGVLGINPTWQSGT
jgi:flavin-dependent dehydrogenase